MNGKSHGDEQSVQLDKASASFGSNAVRLPFREWVVVILISLFALSAIPRLWRQVEHFEAQQDYRVPYELSDDYWTYARLVQSGVAGEQILIVGDSVVWGEYVPPREALPQFLNQRAGMHRFVNGGVNGTHPLALSGLMRYHATELRDSQVLLHCNLLWMSSVERDLQTDKEFAFNHPGLVPQFYPAIPCYKAPIDERMGNVIDQSLSLRTWVQHLRIRDFDNQDMPSWSLEHPYTNPLAQIRMRQVRPLNEPHSPPIPWTERGIPVQDMPWVELATSLQWQGFCETVELLRRRGNSLFVMVGPFNEHLLSDRSRQRYSVIKQEVESWLRSRQIPCYLPAPMPSDEYGDASHPLASGYARLAEKLYQDGAFQSWLAAEL